MTTKWRALKVGLCTALAMAALGCGHAENEDELEAEPSDGSSEPDSVAGLQQAPSLKYVEIKTTGAGCENLPKQNISINAQQSTFTVFTPDFSAHTSKNDASPTASIACNLQVKVSAPAGFTYGISKIYYTGRATLPVGVNANLAVSYGFQGATIKPSTHTLPISVTQPGGEWKKAHELQTISAWSPCNGDGNLLISTNLTIGQTSTLLRSTWQDGSVSLSTIDGETGAAVSPIFPSVTVVLGWKRCDASTAGN